MSLDAYIAVTWGATLDPSAKTVLYTLAEHANKSGIAWPSVDTIARLSGLKRRAVQNHLRGLTEARYISAIGGTTGGRSRCTKYALNLPMMAEQGIANGAPEYMVSILRKMLKGASGCMVLDDVKGAPDDAKGASHGMERVQPSAPEAVRNQKEPLSEAKRKRVSPAKQTRVKPIGFDFDADDFIGIDDEAMDRWRKAYPRARIEEALDEARRYLIGAGTCTPDVTKFILVKLAASNDANVDQWAHAEYERVGGSNRRFVI